MGLDNIPKNYPCASNGTAVRVNRKDRDGNDRFDDNGEPLLVIDCDLTMEAGGCPWKNANPPTEGRVLGMFGCPCWYRGKYGEGLLRRYVDDPDATFYGDMEDGTEKSPKSCVTTANAIADVITNVPDPETAQDLIYAEWYLRWAAEKCDGLICWY